VTSHREAGVLGRGVAIVADNGQDALAPPALPLRIILGQHRGAVDEVAIVEVVVVVDPVPKVHARIGQRGAGLRRGGVVAAVRRAPAVAVVVLAAARDEASPGGVVDKWRLGLGLEPHLHALRQPLHHLHEVLLLRLPELISNGNEPCQAPEQLAGEICVAHAEAKILREVEHHVRHGAVPLRAVGAGRPSERVQQLRAHLLCDRARRLEADVGEEVVMQLPRVCHYGHGRAAQVVEERGLRGLAQRWRQQRHVHWPRQLQQGRGWPATQRLRLPRPNGLAIIAIDVPVDAPTNGIGDCMLLKHGLPCRRVLASWGRRAMVGAGPCGAVIVDGDAHGTVNWARGRDGEWCGYAQPASSPRHKEGPRSVTLLEVDAELQARQRRHGVATNGVTVDHDARSGQRLIRAELWRCASILRSDVGGAADQWHSHAPVACAQCPVQRDAQLVPGLCVRADDGLRRAESHADGLVEALCCRPHSVWLGGVDGVATGEHYVWHLENVTIWLARVLRHDQILPPRVCGQRSSVGSQDRTRCFVASALDTREEIRGVHRGERPLLLATPCVRSFWHGRWGHCHCRCGRHRRRGRRGRKWHGSRSRDRGRLCRQRRRRGCQGWQRLGLQPGHAFGARLRGDPVQRVRKRVPVRRSVPGRESVCRQRIDARVRLRWTDDGLLEAHGPGPTLGALSVLRTLLLVHSQVLRHPVRLQEALHHRRNGQQLDAADNVGGSAEPRLEGGCMLPQDADDRVREGGTVDFGVCAHVPVCVCSVHLHGRHKPAEVLELLGEGRVHLSPIRVEGVVAVNGLAGALLVAAVDHGQDATRP